MSTDDSHSARVSALGNLRSEIDPAVRLPENIFRGNWAAYRFFESDNIFHDKYVAAVKILLALESATAVCVVNLDRPEPNVQDGAAYFLERDSDAVAYRSAMRQIDVGYVGRERFGSTSDVGSWCIYCENSGDVGVMAIRNEVLAQIFEPALRLIWAKPFDVISDNDNPDAVDPFPKLLPEYREGFSKNFR